MSIRDRCGRGLKSGVECDVSVSVRGVLKY